MKNILILADGPISGYFLELISKTRIVENQYHVARYRDGSLPEKMSRTISMCQTDPTSYSKLLKLMSKSNFSMVFIIMQDREDALYTLKNTRLVDEKVRVVLLDKWDESYDDIDNLTVISEHQLMAAHLYDHLPNVPVIAQNVGLGEGEIMEILVPFGSNYSYRHVGSIAQRKWKIAAIYRNKKQIIPTSATTIHPNDILLALGKPMVLDGVYKSINKRMGLFPEPFGKNIYLILDFDNDKDKALIYLKESIYLTDRLEDKKLFVRIINPSDFELISLLKEEEKDNVSIYTCYDTDEIQELIEYDIQNFNIGLILNSIKTFEKLDLMTKLYELRKLVYLFGDKSLYNITDSIVLMTNEAEMESISATAIDLSESLNLKLHLCNFDPEGDLKSKKMIIEHYETLSQIFNYGIIIDQAVVNPIRALQKMENIIQISAYNQHIKRKSIFNLISTKMKDYLLSTQKYPKVLVPVELIEN
ncbi:MAG: TrkA C-terminal domain-containing protein [Campylobacterota bacterium]|nr:TrkA C-terminal domain-containing protein [Campylobacterota bacterium]